jgi:hypothetical protein
MLTLAML